MVETMRINESENDENNIREKKNTKELNTNLAA